MKVKGPCCYRFSPLSAGQPHPSRLRNQSQASGEYHIWSYLEPENTACWSYLEPNQQLNKHIQNQMYRICTEAPFSSSMLYQEKPDLYQSGIIHARPEDRSSIRAMESPSE